MFGNIFDDWGDVTPKPDTGVYYVIMRKPRNRWVQDRECKVLESYVYGPHTLKEASELYCDLSDIYTEDDTSIVLTKEVED